MTVKYFTSSTTGSGSQYLVTGGNGVYVAEGVTVGSTDDYGLSGTGSNDSFDIDGTVYGDLGGISLSAVDNASVQIGANGVVSSDLIDGNAFDLLGFGGSIDNRGQIRGDTGLEIGGSSDVNLSNHGDIATTGHAIHTAAGATGSVQLINYGKIEGTGSFESTSAVQSDGKTVDAIVNLGIINGGLSLGDGKDYYNGVSSKAMDGGLALLLVAIGNTHEKISSFVDAGAGDDQLIGGKYLDYFLGGSGNDSISGGGGNDQLVGSAGADTITGGSGGDQFSFSAASDSTHKKFDMIEDFSHKQHDKIVFGFDANTATPATDKFKFIGTHQFSGQPGELRYEFHGGDTIVLGNIDNDKQAEFELHLHGHIHLTQGDFDL